MKKNKKGFTLIELLAVIVILAIIALIATPIVLNLIEKARKGAAQDSAYGLRKAAQLYYTSSLLENVSGLDITFNCDEVNGCVSEDNKVKLDLDGTIPSNGKIEVKSNGEITYSNIVINGYTCEMENKGEITCTKGGEEAPSVDKTAPTITIGEVTVTKDTITIPYTVDDEEATVVCKYGTDTNYGSTGTIENGICILSGLTEGTEYFYKIIATDSANNSGSDSGSTITISYGITYENPNENTSGLLKIVYLDPTDLTKECNASNAVSTTGTREGCMKWYAYAETDTTYDLILDHNTTALVAWNSSGSNTEMKEVKTALEADTSNWVVTARLIEADEIATITGANTLISWDSTTATTSDYFYFENLSTNTPSPYTGEYGWLYENTNGCTNYGCSISDDNEYPYGEAGEQGIPGFTDDFHGYWTATPVNGTTDGGWRIHKQGNLSSSRITSWINNGVRPVITINK